MLEDWRVELVNENERLYFIPEPVIDGILKNWAVFWLDKSFVTETVIKANLPLAISKRKWYAKSVIRVDDELFRENIENIDGIVKDQIELLTSGVDSRLNSLGWKVTFVPHNLADIKVAIEETVWADYEDTLRGFYSKANMWFTTTNPLVRKWFLINLPIVK